MKRKHISWKTKCASAVLFGSAVPYDDAKQMTEDQFLSLFEWDHNMLVSSRHEDCDKFWNLTPLFRKAHREKTKADAKVIAKSRRIRAKYMPNNPTAVEQFSKGWADYVRSTKPKQKIASRGFDKTLRKKMSGKVVKR